MRIALIGAGYVADFYLLTLRNYPEIQVAGVWDIDAPRLARFCKHYGLLPYSGLDAALADPTVGIVVNLVSVHAHYEVSRRALDAGRHVFSEKPLALRLDEAEDLVRRAQAGALFLSSAPSNGLGPACRKVADLIATGRIGTPQLAYGALEDGPVFRQKWQDWRSSSGAPWPGEDELRVGCTLEHAGYALSWFLALFGGVDRVIAHAALISPRKGPPDDTDGPSSRDYSSGSLIFGGGMVARLTCGLTAPRDHGLTIFGDRGTITVTDLRDSRSTVRLLTTDAGDSLAARSADWVNRKTGWHMPWAAASGRRQRLDGSARGVVLPERPSRIDFAAGIADLARAIKTGTAPHLANAAALHLTEITLRLDGGGPDHGFPADAQQTLINRLPAG